MVEEVEPDLNGTVYLYEGNYEYQVGKGGTNGTKNYASNGGTSWFKDSSGMKIKLSGGKKGAMKQLGAKDLGGTVEENNYDSGFGYPGKTTEVKAFDGVKSAYNGAESVFSSIGDGKRGQGGDSEDIDVFGSGRDDTKGIGGFIRITYIEP